MIKRVRDLGLATGKNAAGVNTVPFDLGATDLGIPFFDRDIGRLYFLFGDSYSGDGHTIGHWNYNVTMYTDRLDFGGNILWDGALDGQIKGMRSSLERPDWPSREITPDINLVNIEDGIVSPLTHTNIPTGGIALGQDYYVFYMEIHRMFNLWGGGSWQVSANRVVKSSDRGKTWKPLRDIIFKQWDAPNFGQVFPLEHEGYVYLFGVQGGRLDIFSFGEREGIINAHVKDATTFGCGIKLARVRKADIEDMSKYEYFGGRKENHALWLKGAEGLQAIRPGAEYHESSFVVRKGLSEYSVFYNKYLDKFILSYMAAGCVVIRTAKELWGPWSEPHHVVSYEDFEGLGGIYGGFGHEVLAADNGKRIYIIMSHWVPTYNVRLLEVELV